MIPFEWTSFAVGLALGAGVCALYFVGLAYGMRIALRKSRPMPILVISAIARMAVLLGVGWAVAAMGGAWAFLGYGVAFFIARFAATTMARVTTPAEAAP